MHSLGVILDGIDPVITSPPSLLLFSPFPCRTPKNRAFVKRGPFCTPDCRNCNVCLASVLYFNESAEFRMQQFIINPVPGANPTGQNASLSRWHHQEITLSLFNDLCRAATQVISSPAVPPTQGLAGFVLLVGKGGTGRQVGRQALISGALCGTEEN